MCNPYNGGQELNFKSEYSKLFRAIRYLPKIIRRSLVIRNTHNFYLGRAGRITIWHQLYGIWLPETHALP